jgi:uncharacterized LabA/DUF88 family protein
MPTLWAFFCLVFWVDMKTAILIDGAYFIKRFRKLHPASANDPKRTAEMAFRLSLLHLRDRNHEKHSHELYRIFFYDCPPLEKKMHNPITKKCIDFSKSNEAIFRNSLHHELRRKRKVALRLGRVGPDVNWGFKPDITEQLLKGTKKIEQLCESDVIPNFRQKGVDMRIGLDITSIALKKQVERIVLMSGDADFVPAAKFARREGIDFILDPMWQNIPDDLFEHIDGLRSTCPRPKK